MTKTARDSLTIIPFNRLPNTKAWKLTSRIVRLKSVRNNVHLQGSKDVAVECYTCGAIIPFSEAVAGHAKEKRGRAAIYFDLRGIRAQCTRCNRHLHGNYAVFTYKLINEIGMKEYKKWEKESQKTKVWTKEELNKIVESRRADLENI